MSDYVLPPTPSPPPLHLHVDLSEFEILRVLGQGAFGKVFQVRKTTPVHIHEEGGASPSTHQIFAMKSVDKLRIAGSKSDIRHTRTERDVLARVKNPFLVRMFYAIETPRRLYFVQEFCRGGELFRLIEAEQIMSEDQARFYLSEVTCALEYLHSVDIVYRDLKAENIMLDEFGHIKLIDFGLSKIMAGGGDSLTHTFCGTLDFMAPEVVLSDPSAPGHGKPADWWTFGVFMFDLLTGRSPFHSSLGQKETQKRILKAKFNVPPFLSPDASDLIRRTVRKSVERRLGARGVKEHAFFAGLDWDKVEARAYDPPFVPQIDLRDETDLSQFDTKFTSQPARESDGVKGGGGGVSAETEAALANMFGDDFDYVFEEEEEDEKEEAKVLPAEGGGAGRRSGGGETFGEAFGEAFGGCGVELDISVHEMLFISH